jgi:hypothetical protein
LDLKAAAYSSFSKRSVSILNVGESVVPYHLAHADRIGHCLPIKQPTITVEPLLVVSSRRTGESLMPV